MHRLPDGKYIAFGYSKSKTSDSTFAQLFKMDTAMNVLWSKTFTFNNQMRTTDITPTADGGFILAGRTWQTPTAATKQGGFVIRTDSIGATKWTRIIKFDGSETMLKVMEEADATLRYFVTGSTTTHYMKAAADGTPTNAPVAPTNGAFDLVSHKVVKLGAERYAVVGRFQNTADLIMVLNKDTIQWTKEYIGIINTGRILNITTDAKGDLYLAGDTLNVIGGSTATTTSIFTWSSSTNTPWNTTTTKSRITVKPTAFGDHLFNLIIKDDNGCVNSGTAVVTVRQSVTPTVTLDPIGCPGPDLTLRARGTNEGASPYFDWLIDGSGLVGGRRELILANAIGKKVQVIMNVGADVCPLAPGTRQVKSPIITVTCQGVATQTIAELQSLMVFPNPTTGDVNVKLNLDAPKTVGFKVSNLLGQTVQVVAPRKLDSGETLQSFQLYDVAKGLYLIETNIEGKRIISKVQVQ
jgi:Secretion system C-terminal sorting domain